MSYDHLKTSNYAALQVTPETAQGVRASKQPSFQSVQMGDAPEAEKPYVRQPTAQRVGQVMRVTTSGNGDMIVEEFGPKRASGAAVTSILSGARSHRVRASQ